MKIKFRDLVALSLSKENTSVNTDNYSYNIPDHVITDNLSVAFNRMFIEHQYLPFKDSTYSHTFYNTYKNIEVEINFICAGNGLESFYNLIMDKQNYIVKFKFDAREKLI
ncbi:MAG: hypothetical protein RSE41_00320 [Clostridia bacterium]